MRRGSFFFGGDEVEVGSQPSNAIGLREHNFSEMKVNADFASSLKGLLLDLCAVDSSFGQLGDTASVSP